MALTVWALAHHQWHWYWWTGWPGAFLTYPCFSSVTAPGMGWERTKRVWPRVSVANEVEQVTIILKCLCSTRSFRADISGGKKCIFFLVTLAPFLWKQPKLNSQWLKASASGSPTKQYQKACICLGGPSRADHSWPLVLPWAPGFPRSQVLI